tara:strand:+ start:282 stop:395 length:114 start_codon:yes stop_codon:yes gene_type:complete
VGKESKEEERGDEAGEEEGARKFTFHSFSLTLGLHSI